jgi:hypothetical protein
MSPTMAPKPILYVVEQVSAAALTGSEAPPKSANRTSRTSARRVIATTVKKISLKCGAQLAVSAQARRRPGSPASQRSAFRSSTPSYTAQMGHWSESLVDDVARQLGGTPDRTLLASLLETAGREIEVLSGRSFHGVRRTTSTFEPNGLPLVEVPDIHIGSVHCAIGVWEIRDPVDPAHATVLQLVPVNPPVRKAAPVGEALKIGGQLVWELSRAGGLSASYVLHWLGRIPQAEQRRELLQRIANPAVRCHVPVVGVAIGGWWFQIARRLLWVTNEVEDEGRLVELLLADEATAAKVPPLAATEPVLIVARITRQPVDWAFTVRIWSEGARRPADRPWSILAKAVHGHGVPTITIDPGSTPQEIACQLILKAYWHGYINGDEPELASAVAAAYPQPVERIRRSTYAPSTASAAAKLLEQLIQPGFDPAQGAEATRRYVRRKASIVVMEYRKQENPERYPWTQVGISERRFYKLLPRFAQKLQGRYDYNRDDVVARMRAYLDALDNDRGVQADARELLRSRGFHDAAARKWLQRHRPEDAVHAWPHRACSPEAKT